MRYSEVANRYAAALFDLAKTSNKNDEYLASLQTIKNILVDNETFYKFISSPLVRAEEKIKTLEKALAAASVPNEVKSFVLLLAKKGRLTILEEVVWAYQACSDAVSGVSRGTVKSVALLTDEQKAQITTKISGALNKKVVLQFVQDKNLIASVCAQVGSYTFDDSVFSHIKRIKEDLNRRIN